ncbi:unnamed protein product, partial [Symbiodinium microadriaticum]
PRHPKQHCGKQRGVQHLWTALACDAFAAAVGAGTKSASRRIHFELRPGSLGHEQPVASQPLCSRWDVTTEHSLSAGDLQLGHGLLRRRPLGDGPQAAGLEHQ